jgi:hypothetical protein
MAASCCCYGRFTIAAASHPLEQLKNQVTALYNTLHTDRQTQIQTQAARATHAPLLFLRLFPSSPFSLSLPRVFINTAPSTTNKENRKKEAKSQNDLVPKQTPRGVLCSVVLFSPAPQCRGRLAERLSIDA